MSGDPHVIVALGLYVGSNRSDRRFEWNARNSDARVASYARSIELDQVAPEWTMFSRFVFSNRTTPTPPPTNGECASGT
jgi:hypothetical protein